MNALKGITWILGIVLLLLVITTLALSINDFPRAKKDAWQAVFLANNQVYFGHIVRLNKEYVGLADVYYLQALQALQQGAPGRPPDLSIVKLGGELHGPEDFMYIPKRTIVFWENLRPDSQVVQAIMEFRAQRQQ
ncbi:MAG: hypothetical protein HY436_01600 [Candidatus Liptonbacteria bacterium]|nr:hypothetical protein [Candidatus Liptonbacteria bacterium]